MVRRSIVVLMAVDYIINKHNRLLLNEHNVQIDSLFDWGSDTIVSGDDRRALV